MLVSYQNGMYMNIDIIQHNDNIDARLVAFVRQLDHKARAGGYSRTYIRGCAEDDNG